MKIGYARVSTEDQKLDLQIQALKKQGCKRIYTDHGVSGRDFERAGLDAGLLAADKALDFGRRALGGLQGVGGRPRVEAGGDVLLALLAPPPPGAAPSPSSWRDPRPAPSPSAPGPRHPARNGSCASHR